MNPGTRAVTRSSKSLVWTLHNQPTGDQRLRGERLKCELQQPGARSERLATILLPNCPSEACTAGCARLGSSRFDADFFQHLSGRSVTWRATPAVVALRQLAFASTLALAWLSWQWVNNMERDPGNQDRRHRIEHRDHENPWTSVASEVVTAG